MQMQNREPFEVKRLPFIRIRPIQQYLFN